MRSGMLLLGITLFVGSLQLGCEMKQQLKDMHDNTAEMNNTTGDLSDSTKKTVQLMSELYDASRQGTSLDLRKKLFDSIMQEKALDAKMVNAGKYYMAFEFELWSGQGQDQEANRRDLLARDAVLELFNHLKTIARWDDQNWDPFASPDMPSFAPEMFSKTNQMAAFNALAATAHYVNRKQVPAAEQNKQPVLSMVSLIEKSLLAGQQIRNGEKRIEDFPEYVDQVLQTESLAIRFLKARYTMLGVMVVCQVSRLSKGVWDAIKIKVLGRPWTLETDKMSPSEIRSYQALLDEAARTKEILKQVGVDAKLDDSVKKIFAKMVVPPSSASPNNIQVQQWVQESEKLSFVRNLNDYWKTN